MPRISLRLPGHLGAIRAESIIDIVRRIDQSDARIVDLDATELRFIEPFGLCVLSCAGKRWRLGGKQVRFINCTDSMKNYLERMNVLEHCGCDDRPAIDRAERPDALVAVTRIARQSDVNDGALDLARAIVGIVPNIAPDANIEGMRVESESSALVLAISHVLGELMDNSLTHGRRAGYTDAEVWISCQYVGARDAIRLGVVDDGCGLLNSLRAHPSVREEPSHERAIRQAFVPGVSCNREVGLKGVESRNLGMGLTICNDIAQAAGGSMWVGTGDRWMRNPRGGEESYILETAGWQGLLASIETFRGRLKTVAIDDIVTVYRPKNVKTQLRFG